MDKAMWIRAHEELIAEYLENHPGLPWDAAYEVTAGMVDDRLRDHWADQIDQARMEDKYGE